MVDRRVWNTLQQLYRIVEAGEKGYATAAANVSDPALKVLFRMSAQERAGLKNELLATMRDLGKDSYPSQSILGAIHRGRVAIFAAMAVDKAGQISAVTKEVALGERIAVHAYRTALSKPLPPVIRDMLVRHLAVIHKAQDQVNCLRGQGERRCVVRVFGNHHDTIQIVRRLIGAGFAPEEISTISIRDDMLYQDKGATVAETVASGAFGGALWGGVTGLLAGFGVVETTSPVGTAAIAVTWALVFLGFILIGALISSILALFIGLNISGEDSYDSSNIHADAGLVVRLQVDKVRVEEVAKILDVAGVDALREG